MSERSSALLLSDLLDSCSKILSYTEGISFEDFIQDNKTLDAVIRNFEIIGEAANRLPHEFKDLHSDIDWHKMRGLRNRVVHHYFGIDYTIVWEIVTAYIPPLLSKLKSINADTR